MFLVPNNFYICSLLYALLKSYLSVFLCLPNCLLFFPSRPPLLCRHAIPPRVSLTPSFHCLGLVLAACSKLQHYISHGYWLSPHTSYDYDYGSGDELLGNEVT